MRRRPDMMAQDQYGLAHRVPLPAQL